jgi:hypothetical protein
MNIPIKRVEQAPDGFLTTAQAAEYLGVKPDFLHNKRTIDIPRIKAGGTNAGPIWYKEKTELKRSRVFYKPADLDAYRNRDLERYTPNSAA